MMMIEWIKLTSPEIALLDRKLPVMVPLGLVEAHGSHLAVSVDIDSATYFARNVAEKTGVILAPVMTYGFADEMAGYPGTLGVTAETFTQVIIDLCKMFCAHDFKKVIFLTGHGANKIPCELAFYKVWETYPDFKGVCWNWWSDCGIEGIHHADKGETEVALAIGSPSRMAMVKNFKMDKPWYKIRSRYALNPLSGGVNGNPGDADIEHGKQIIKRALDSLVGKVLQAIDD